MPNIFDNIEKHLKEGLLNTLSEAKRADFCVGYFNLRGWDIVLNHINKLEGDHLPDEVEDDSKYYGRVIIGMQRHPKDEVRDSYLAPSQNLIDTAHIKKYVQKVSEEFYEQLTRIPPNNKDEKTLKLLAEQLHNKKLIVKLFLKNTLHAKLYLIHKKDYNSPLVGFVGSSNLTYSGIAQQGELNVDVVEGDAARKLSNWFQDRWEDSKCIDISETLATIIDNSWAAKNLFQPYHLYLKVIYHLSREARSGISLFKIPSVFKNKLLSFQENAVKRAAHHLYHRGGVIIGDVVGLGKTITATALAKIFEEDFSYQTLIICPKNLRKMWKDYAHKYHLRAKVLSITQVQKKLPDERKYKLVVIDESHNLRNRDGGRYKAIKEYIRGYDSKVILLTATPYNKTYLDLSNQLRLFLDETYNLGVSPELYIESVGGRINFTSKHQVDANSIAAFEYSNYSDDWSQLMRLFLVRRTRSFIKNNEAIDDKENGRKYLEFPDGSRSYFPERYAKKVEYVFDANDPDDQYAKLYSEKVVKIIDKLILPRYGLGQDGYFDNDPSVNQTKAEILIKTNLGKAGTRLIGFARTNLFKRLESSGYSFLLSISRHILRNYLFIYAIDNNLKFPIGKQVPGLIDKFINSDVNIEDLEYEIDLPTNQNEYLDRAKEYYKKLDVKHKSYDWIRSQLFNDELKNDLKKDSRELMKILDWGRDWKQGNDRQLNALFDMINDRHKDEKLLIFTQYSDTANYLYNALKKRKVDHLECVTGASDNPTDSAYRFSPVSNEHDMTGKDEIRVMITTDVLSEGQNLQDAHIVLNYDLPWAIIRLIQRAGRVDRIGQKHHEILCYSFLPEAGIENIIKLRERLKTRIKQNAETVGSDEVFFEGDPINIKDLYNEKSGILDEEDNDIDLASYAYQIWKDAVKEDPQLEKKVRSLPDSIFATKKADESQDKNGSVVYTKTSNDNDVLSWIDENNNVVTQSQKTILFALKCDKYETPLERIENHHELVVTGLKHIRNVEKKIGGQLGKKSGARYRVHTRISKYSDKQKNTLFENHELKHAMQDIYDFPLREIASERISRMLKTGCSDVDLAELVLNLRENNLLSLVRDTDETEKEPQIICSMGLKVK
ncbi:MAG: NgoFVII family restriction endonuclease [Chlorobi bacterium]|nr:NgoFVII family restriction endonuclease [Chlorobiota bacterium]